MHLRCSGHPDDLQRHRRFLPAGRRGRSNDMLDLLARQIASPVQFINGPGSPLRRGRPGISWRLGRRKALKGLVDGVLGDKADLVSLFTNHPKTGGLAVVQPGPVRTVCRRPRHQAGWNAVSRPPSPRRPRPGLRSQILSGKHQQCQPAAAATTAGRADLPQITVNSASLFAEFMQRGNELLSGQPMASAAAPTRIGLVVSGAALGLPGTRRSCSTTRTSGGFCTVSN